MAKSNNTQMTTTASWTPIVTLDLKTASTAAFEEAVVKIEAYRKTNPSTPVDLKSLLKFDGLTLTMTATPQVAEQCLLNNAGNRKPRLSKVIHWAYLMEAKKWCLSQPWLFNDQGELEDAQHRAWAVYLSMITIETTVTVVPKRSNLFAVIDSGTPRSAADAVYTAGNDGQSLPIAQAIKLLWKYDNNGLSVMKKQPKIRSLYNEEVLAYLDEHYELKDIAHLLAGSHGEAVKLIKNQGVAVAFAYLIREKFDDVVLNEFFQLLGSGSLDDSNPIMALRQRFLAALSKTTESDLKSPQRLALCIKAFNMWQDGEIVKKGLFLRDNEKFPKIEPARQQQAA